jgi:hypothetical protein
MGRLLFSLTYYVRYPGTRRLCFDASLPPALLAFFAHGLLRTYLPSPLAFLYPFLPTLLFLAQR